MLDKLKSFLIGNNLLTTMAGVTIGFSTGVMMRSFVGDIFLPLIYRMFIQRIKGASAAFAPINKLNIDNFLKDFVSWVFVIIFTFMLIEYVMRRLVLNVPVVVPAVVPAVEAKKSGPAGYSAGGPPAGGSAGGPPAGGSAGYSAGGPPAGGSAGYSASGPPAGGPASSAASSAAAASADAGNEQFFVRAW